MIGISTCWWHGKGLSGGEIVEDLSILQDFLRPSHVKILEVHPKVRRKDLEHGIDLLKKDYHVSLNPNVAFL